MVTRAGEGTVPAVLRDSSCPLAAARACACGAPHRITTHLGRPGGRQRLAALQRPLPRQLHPRPPGEAAARRPRRRGGMALIAQRPGTEEGASPALAPAVRFARPIEARHPLEAAPDPAAAAPRWRVGRRRCGGGGKPEKTRSFAARPAADASADDPARRVGPPAWVGWSAGQRHGSREKRREAAAAAAGAAAASVKRLLPQPLPLSLLVMAMVMRGVQGRRQRRRRRRGSVERRSG